LTAKIEPGLSLEALQTIAEAFTQDPAQLALDIHAVADHIESLGNRSIDTGVLRERKLPVYFLTEVGRPALDGILFYNKEWDGWQCRKNPYWLDQWCARFERLTHPEIQRIAGDWVAIKAQREAEAAEAARPKRKSEEFEQGQWKDFTTDQIGLRLSMATLVEIYFYALRQSGRRTSEWHDDLLGYLAVLARRAHQSCASELEYRAAIGDVDAKRAVTDNTRYFADEDWDKVQAGKALPWDLTPKNPLPFVPKVVHVRSSEWINCDESERVYIGRKVREFADTGWGNPHKVGDSDSSRLEAVELFRQELIADPVRLRKLEELRGKRVLGCWCKDAGRHYRNWSEHDKPCHGDVLRDLLALPTEELEKLIDQAEGE